MAEQLWGRETTKAVENFPISGERVPISVIRWLARIKGAGAVAFCHGFSEPAVMMALFGAPAQMPFAWLHARSPSSVGRNYSRQISS